MPSPHDRRPWPRTAPRPDSHRITLRRSLNAPPDVVFDAWTSPEKLQAWYGLDDSWTTPEAEIDLRVGGRYRIRLAPPGEKDFEESGQYLLVEPPLRLTYTCESKNSRTVSVDFNPCPSGTDLLLAESGYTTAELRDMHAAGWQRFIDRLARLVERAES